MSRRAVMACLLAPSLVVSSECLSQALPSSNQASPLALGKMADVQSAACPAGFFAGMICSTAMVENCAGTVPLGLTYGVETPTGTLKGTIVLHGGGKGTHPFNEKYVPAYLAAGYQVVQLAWDSDWELVGAGQSASLKSAACRPATFFAYAYSSIYGGASGTG